MVIFGGGKCLSVLCDRRTNSNEGQHLPEVTMELLFSCELLVLYWIICRGTSTSWRACCVGVGGDGHNTMGAGSSHVGALAAFGDGRGYREGEDLAEARGDGTLRRLGVP